MEDNNAKEATLTMLRTQQEQARAEQIAASAENTIDRETQPIEVWDLLELMAEPVTLEPTIFEFPVYPFAADLPEEWDPIIEEAIDEGLVEKVVVLCPTFLGTAILQPLVTESLKQAVAREEHSLSLLAEGKKVIGCKSSHKYALRRAKAALSKWETTPSLD
jgi:hypothetical protein